MKIRRSVPALLLAAALSLGLLTAPAAAAPTYDVDTTIQSEVVYGQKTQAAKGFAIASGVLRGDNTGALNWCQTLTRAEAATMLVRLLGMDAQAEAAKSQPSPFTDVPAWARGYVNVAAAEGLAKGVGGGRFNPSGSCAVRDFITMLYRMTDLKEGTDFSWATALDDFIEDVKAVDGYFSNHWSLEFSFSGQAERMAGYFKAGGAFTREAACDVIYFMLNIKAGPGDESLGDLLSAKYGMSDLLLFNHSVRRTQYALRGITSLTFENFTGLTPTAVSVRDGRLYVEDGRAAEMLISFPDDPDLYQECYPCTGAVGLPRREKVRVSLVWGQEVLSGYDEDGDPIYYTDYIGREFYAFLRDGTWSLSKWDTGREGPDYGYIYAYRSEEHFAAVVAEHEGVEMTIAPEVQALADRLTAGKKTGLEKADAISEWVATHIFYDHPEARGETPFSYRTAEETLAVRRGVCAQYSTLTMALMRAAGLECYSEGGQGHAWNVARLDGKWVMIDNTWDSPLSYNYTAGSGYQALVEVGIPGRVGVERRAVGNIMEPGIPRLKDKLYFNMDLEEFYSSHRLERDPQFANRTVLNINDVL